MSRTHTVSVHLMQVTRRYKHNHSAAMCTRKNHPRSEATSENNSSRNARKQLHKA
jgi:hypothetical protein